MADNHGWHSDLITSEIKNDILLNDKALLNMIGCTEDKSEDETHLYAESIRFITWK